MAKAKRLDTASMVRRFVGDTVLLMRQQSDDVRILRIPVEPAPASRPKVGKYGVYYSKAHQRFRNEARPWCDAWDAETYTPIWEGPIAILVEVVCTRPKTGKLIAPRGDVDNFVKIPLDNMTQSGKFWTDDMQILILHTAKRYAVPGEEAGVNIHWHKIEEITNA